MTTPLGTIEFMRTCCRIQTSAYHTSTSTFSTNSHQTLSESIKYPTPSPEEEHIPNTNPRHVLVEGRAEHLQNYFVENNKTSIVVDKAENAKGELNLVDVANLLDNQVEARFLGTGHCVKRGDKYAEEVLDLVGDGAGGFEGGLELVGNASLPDKLNESLRACTRASSSPKSPFKSLPSSAS